MSKRAAGIGFCLIAALLYATRYLGAAVVESSTRTWGPQAVYQFLGSVGPSYAVMGLSLLIGLGYLAWAEVEEYRRASNRKRS